MTRKVLILNVTRMGDLVQSGALLARLRHEWPDVMIDVVVDRQFATMADLLPGVRAVHTFDFRGLADDCRVMRKDVVTLYREFKQWAAPLAAETYDRIVNLTFTRRSGLLASYLGAPDVRGITCAPDGSTVVRNSWMTYFTALHRYRRFNRFNLVDVYALGGSGVGPFAPLSLKVGREATGWAHSFLGPTTPPGGWVAVQVGASEAIKAWRPAAFGQTMARLGRLAQVGFVLIGTTGEAEAVRAALAAYRHAGGVAPVREAVGRTSLTQLMGLFGLCRLLLTNDTGPMHMAVAAGIPVVDVSVGHVDFRETGPYGRGHWVVQPDLPCAPCGFDQVCAHHACKDRVETQHVAELCAHVLGRGPCPTYVAGVRLYESDVDADGLVAYQQRTGGVPEADEWYGRLWRQFWYADFTGRPMQTRGPEASPPDWANLVEQYRRLQPLSQAVRERVDRLRRVVAREPLAVRDVQKTHCELSDLQRRIVHASEGSPAFGPLTVALWRDLENDEGMSLRDMVQVRHDAFHRWMARVERLYAFVAGRRLDGEVTAPRRQSEVHSAELPMLRPI